MRRTRIKAGTQFYFPHNNLYSLNSADSLILLPHFEICQQHTDYTCGAAVALMVLKHNGIYTYTEEQIAKSMGIRKPEGSEKGLYGTSTRQLTMFFSRLNFEVQSSLDKNNPPLNCVESFRDWVIQHLNDNIPIMVEWIDWGGHWQVIIGYDTMGTPDTENDLLILADPYAISDHQPGGYYVFSVERFLSMWFDCKYLPDGENEKQWVIAKPGKESLHEEI